MLNTKKKVKCGEIFFMATPIRLFVFLPIFYLFRVFSMQINVAYQHWVHYENYDPLNYALSF